MSSVKRFRTAYKSWPLHSNGDPIPDGVSEISESDIQTEFIPMAFSLTCRMIFYALEEAVKLEDSTIESIVVPVTHDEYLPT